MNEELEISGYVVTQLFPNTFTLRMYVGALP